MTLDRIQAPHDPNDPFIRRQTELGPALACLFGPDCRNHLDAVVDDLDSPFRHPDLTYHEAPQVLGYCHHRPEATHQAIGQPSLDLLPVVVLPMNRRDQWHTRQLRDERAIGIAGEFVGEDQGDPALPDQPASCPYPPPIHHPPHLKNMGLDSLALTLFLQPAWPEETHHRPKPLAVQRSGEGVHDRLSATWSTRARQVQDGPDYRHRPHPPPSRRELKEDRFPSRRSP